MPCSGVPCPKNVPFGHIFGSDTPLDKPCVSASPLRADPDWPILGLSCSFAAFFADAKEERPHARPFVPAGLKTSLTAWPVGVFAADTLRDPAISRTLWQGR
jgi:hypothetical protein